MRTASRSREAIALRMIVGADRPSLRRPYRPISPTNSNAIHGFDSAELCLKRSIDCRRARARCVAQIGEKASDGLANNGAHRHRQNHQAATICRIQRSHSGRWTLRKRATGRRYGVCPQQFNARPIGKERRQITASFLIATRRSTAHTEIHAHGVSIQECVPIYACHRFIDAVPQHSDWPLKRAFLHHLYPTNCGKMRIMRRQTVRLPFAQPRPPDAIECSIRPCTIQAIVCLF